MRDQREIKQSQEVFSGKALWRNGEIMLAAYSLPPTSDHCQLTTEQSN